LTLAAVLAAAVASTWYAFNARALYDYLQSATYGETAHMFAGGSSLTWENAVLYVNAFVLEGPGVPLCAAGAVAALLAVRAHGAAFVKSPTMAALFGAFALDFAILMLAAQRCGSMLFLSVLPVFAIAVVRAALAVPGALGAGLRAVVMILTAASAVGATFAFPKAPGTAGGDGPFAPALPLYSHRSIYLSSITAPFDPFADYRTGEVFDRIESLRLPRGAAVTVLTDHPYVSAHGYRGEALRRGLDWKWVQAPPIALRKSQGDEPWLESVRRLAAAGDAVVLRNAESREPPSRQYRRALEPLLTGESSRLAEEGEAILLGDGSSVAVYRRRP
jgi:hypothetical protein